MAESKRSTGRLVIPFKSEEHATIAAASIGADPELNAERVRRTVKADGASLVLEFDADDARVLRPAMSAAIDSAGVVARTLRDFA